MKKLNFKAETKSGKQFNLYWDISFYKPGENGDKSYAIYAESDNGEKVEVALSKEKEAIAIGHYEGKVLLGKSISGYIRLTSDWENELDKVSSIADNKKETIINDKISSIKDSADIEIYKTAGSFGWIYSMHGVELEYEIQRRIIDSIKVELENKDFDSDGEGGYEFQTTMSEIREMQEIEKDRVSKNEQQLNKKFEEASRTGKPVVISKRCVPESQSPLRGDGENDMVDIVTLAMPDGTTKEECTHNY